MKKVIIMLSALATVSCSVQNKTTNKPLMIPLKVGRENQPVQFETLRIEPIYLIVQDRSPKIELRLEATESNSSKKFSTTLPYSYSGHNIHDPIAFENYIFSLKINNDNVHLVVEKLDFGKVFFIEFEQKALIGNFSISFEDSASAWYEDPFENYLESREYFKILVSDYNEQKELCFGALYARGREKKLFEYGSNKDSRDKLLFEWKGYRIFVLDAGGRLLKLKIDN